MKHVLFVFSILQCFVISVFSQTMIFEETFDVLDRNRWMHLITAWRGGNSEFQYYTNRTENRLITIYYTFCFDSLKTNINILLQCHSYVKNGVLFIKPTLTADRFNNNFLYTGTLDLNREGCNLNLDNGCSV